MLATPLIVGCYSHYLMRTNFQRQGVTSEKEWEFVVAPQLDVKYVERSGDFRELHPDWCHKLVPPAELEVRMSAVNERLVAAGHTEMVVDELIGGRLYTGPMYEKVRAHDSVTFASVRKGVTHLHPTHLVDDYPCAFRSTMGYSVSTVVAERTRRVPTSPSCSTSAR